jgi:FkbM family methyltransferase
MISIIKHAIYSILFEKPRGIRSFPPCYKIHTNKNKSRIVVDIGTGATADFSQAMIDTFGATCFGFDPTRKHQQTLQAIVEKNNGNFIFFPYALSTKNGKLIFYESYEKESGSFSIDHTNIKHDAHSSYKVNAITLTDILTLINQPKVSVLKLDCEGEEYALVQTANPETFNSIGQIVIEFHHHCIDRFTVRDTRHCVKILRQFGFKSYSVDAINYLFYK